MLETLDEIVDRFFGQDYMVPKESAEQIDTDFEWQPPKGGKKHGSDDVSVVSNNDD